MDGDTLPPELLGVPNHILLAYVEGCLDRVACHPTLAQRLQLPSSQLQNAVHATFDELYRPEASLGLSSQLKLVFRHDCLNLTCFNPRCVLCSQNPNKRCPDGVNFQHKYLEKNPLKAKCNASIRIDVVNAATGVSAHPQRLEDVQLELSMLDGKKFAAMHETGEDLASCELFVSKAGKDLLSPGRLGTQTEERRVRMSLTARGQAVLGNDLCVLVSSEAMLGNQKPPYKLLVRAVNQQSGQEVPYITSAVSEDFVVATARVAKAQKAEIPCVDDPVSKLEDIGDKTSQKLLDVQSAAEAAGVCDVVFPDKSVVTVGQFKQLVELANSDPRFSDKLKKELIPGKAREHLNLAVDNDKRLRMWYPEPNNTVGGLLFRSVRARVDLEHPDVLVQHRVLPDGTTQPDLTPCGQVAGNQKEVLRKLVVQAKEDWKAPDHPNWSVRDMDSGQFLDSMQPGQFMYDAPQNPSRIDIGRGINLTPNLGGTFQSPSAAMNHDSGRMGSGLVNSALHSSGHGSTHGSGHMGSGLLQGHDIGLQQGSGHHRQMQHSTSPQLGSHGSHTSEPMGSGRLSGHSLNLLEHNSLHLGSGHLGSGQLAQPLGHHRSHSGPYAAAAPSSPLHGHMGSVPLHSGGLGNGHPFVSQLQSNSPFANPVEHFDNGNYAHSNGGYDHFSSGHSHHHGNAFDGFRNSPHSPFGDFSTQHSGMADIFPSQAAALQPATSQAHSAGLNHLWPATSAASGPLYDHSRSLDLHSGLHAEQRSSHGSASLGSGANAAGAAMNSPNISHNSALASVPASVPSYHPSLDSGSLVDLLDAPTQSSGAPSYDRSLSGREPGAKRARKPAESQPLPVLSDPATIGPEIMHHQQLLRQRNNSNPSMPPPNHYPSMTHHHSGAQQLPDPHQLRHASSAPKGGALLPEAPAFLRSDIQQPHQSSQQGQHQQPDDGLQSRLSSHLNSLTPIDEAFLAEISHPTEGFALLSQQSLKLLETPASQSPEPQTSQAHVSPGSGLPPLHHNFLNDRSDAERRVRWQPDQEQGRGPSGPSAAPAEGLGDPQHSNGELIPNVDPARARWAQKDRWSSGNIFASFGSRVRRQLGASGKSDGLESMKDIDDALPDIGSDWDDAMSIGHSFKSRDMKDDDDHDRPSPDNTLQS